MKTGLPKNAGLAPSTQGKATVGSIPLPPPSTRIVVDKDCQRRHQQQPWLIKLGFVSVGYPPQRTDICVCHRHVNNVGPTHRRHSVRLAYFFADKVMSGNHIPDTLFYV